MNLLFVYIFINLPVVYSHCYLILSQTWICNDYYKSNATKKINSDYQNILNSMQFTNFHLKNYYVLTLKIDNYPSKLRLFNASNNQIERIIITSKNRYISNLRQLILESNHIRQFNSDTIILPQSLEIISLANNHLEILDARIFSHLKNLTELNLKNNQLKRILPELLLRLKIHLNNNPLDCQCTPKFYRAVCEKSTNSKQSTVRNIYRMCRKITL